MSALLLLTLSGAAPVSAQQKDTASAAVTAAQAAAEPWLQLIDHLRYGESWESAAAPFRLAITKGEWESAVLQVRGPLEPVRGRRLLSATLATTLPNAAPGQYVILQYEVQGAGKRAVIETVTPMMESDSVWRVSGYYVRER